MKRSIVSSLKAHGLDKLALQFTKHSAHSETRVHGRYATGSVVRRVREAQAADGAAPAKKARAGVS